MPKAFDTFIKSSAWPKKRAPWYTRGSFGVPERNRTPGLPLRRGTLYPTELLGQDKM